MASDVQVTNGASKDASTDGKNEGISEEEIALYDRQIRLWGMKAQEKIRTANILLITCRALGNEIAKNLVLAGIGSITILDHEVVSPDDLGAQFLITEADIGKPRAEAVRPPLQKMNPRVTITADTSIAALKDPSFYATFTLTIATDLDYTALCTINEAANFSARPFYAACLHGLYGFAFADLITHDYQIERQVLSTTTLLGPETPSRTLLSVTPTPSTGPGAPHREVLTKREVYYPLRIANSSPLPPTITRLARRKKQVPPLLTCARALFEFQAAHLGRSPSHAAADLAAFTQLARATHDMLSLPRETLTAEFLKGFLASLHAEVAPAAAWVGGFVAQDVINVLGRREQPLQNFGVFDGESGEARVFALQPIFEAEGMGNGMAMRQAGAQASTDQAPL
ncbi:hypothetical protein P152DRAFT_308981 [Eremomyces bilateralis CBS 781.70]|uniref:THIF-type NAD/FAD binding fold domain-containing protein n=1 Tax=Eremomyces bilateralis CBS 781.70 TaxID=1392243 RepID=A0A6G1G5A2_9PEZI|nr:uncharacterized protein P152DRAFT_308981 [Eremomyces bilateralis CBS 781.70]KAF1813198.1 hypothetical protein P152DRAFT_308981 [Eremomyces bilateralis CBS 781.70]